MIGELPGISPFCGKVILTQEGFSAVVLGGTMPPEVGCDSHPDAITREFHRRWRNRAEFLQGRKEIVAFLTRKWNRELDYRLVKEVWAFHENRIAVRFAYEYRDDNGQYFRAYGNENWEFDGEGLMRVRIASINDLPIKASDCKFHWPLGHRPDDHPGLSALGL